MVFRRNGAGDIYQVDLIAALFAGYTIIWITTSDKQDILLAQTELALGTLSMTVTGEVAEAGRVMPYRHRAGPLELREVSCTPDSFEPFLDMNEAELEFCLTSSTPRSVNDNNDALSVLEDIVNPNDRAVTSEPCANSTDYKTRQPEFFDRIAEASLIDLGWPAGLNIVGMAYSDDTAAWPSPLHGQANDRIPRYIAIRGRDNWNPVLGEPPYACSYVRDHERLFSAIFVASDFDENQALMEFRVLSGRGRDLYHVFSDTIGEAESFASIINDRLLDPAEGLYLQGDWYLKKPELSLRFCLHEDGQAQCWSGTAPLQAGQVISLMREN